jgi:hypothetical protein
MNTEKDTIEIMVAVSEHIKKYGIKKTLSVLSTIENNYSEDPYVNFIVDIVCCQFNIDSKDLLQALYLRGDNKTAAGFCVYYLYEKMSLGDIQKAIFPNKDVSIMSRYKSLIEDLNPKFKSDIQNIKIKEILDKKINTYYNGK